MSSPFQERRAHTFTGGPSSARKLRRKSTHSETCAERPADHFPILRHAARPGAREARPSRDREFRDSSLANAVTRFLIGAGDMNLRPNSPMSRTKLCTTPANRPHPSRPLPETYPMLTMRGTSFFGMSGARSIANPQEWVGETGPRGSLPRFGWNRPHRVRTWTNICATRAM